MTKRFQIIGENYTNIDMPVFVICRENDCCFEVYESKEDAERVCDKLNHLIDENEQLKSDLDYFKAKNGSLETGMFNLERENKQLKQLIKKVLQTTPIEHSLAIDLKNIIRELYE